MREIVLGYVLLVGGKRRGNRRLLGGMVLSVKDGLRVACKRDRF